MAGETKAAGTQPTVNTWHGEKPERGREGGSEGEGKGGRGEAVSVLHNYIKGDSRWISVNIKFVFYTLKVGNGIFKPTNHCPKD